MHKYGFLSSLLSIALVLFSFSAQANVLGAFESFQPSADSLDFETVQSGRVLEKNHFNLGFYAAYMKNGLTVFDNLESPNPTYRKYYDSAETFDFIAAWSFAKNFEVTYNLTGYISQEPASGQNPRYTVTRGPHSQRAALKWNGYSTEHMNTALIGSIDLPEADNDPYTGGTKRPIFNFEAANSWHYGPNRYAINVGYRNRSRGPIAATAPTYPLGDQFIASLGYAHDLTERLVGHIELFGSSAIDKGEYPNSRYASSVETLAGLSNNFGHGWVGHVGGTVETMPKGLSPDWRIYAGVNWTFGFDEKPSPAATPAPTPTPRPVAVKRAKPQPDLPVLDGIADESYLEVLTGERHVVRPKTGVVPFTYTTDDPGSRVEDNSYYAPLQPGKDTIYITDATDHKWVVHVTVKQAPKPARVLQLNKLNFIFNTTKLTATSQQRLELAIRTLRQHKMKKLVVKAYTDAIGSDQYNLKLSQARARRIADIISTKLPFDRENISDIGFGKKDPIATNDTAEGRAENRRVTLLIYE